MARCWRSRFCLKLSIGFSGGTLLAFQVLFEVKHWVLWWHAAGVPGSVWHVVISCLCLLLRLVHSSKGRWLKLGPLGAQVFRSNLMLLFFQFCLSSFIFFVSYFPTSLTLHWERGNPRCLYGNQLPLCWLKWLLLSRHLWLNEDQAFGQRSEVRPHLLLRSSAWPVFSSDWESRSCGDWPSSSLSTFETSHFRCGVVGLEWWPLGQERRSLPQLWILSCLWDGGVHWEPTLRMLWGRAALAGPSRDTGLVFSEARTVCEMFWYIFLTLLRDYYILVLYSPLS